MSTAADDWSEGVDDLDPAQILAALTVADHVVRQGEVDKIRLALRWCDQHPVTPESGVAGWAGAHLGGILDSEETLGGDGTPPLAAFSPEPFAAALGVSTDTGIQILSDALDLAHRLPIIWASVQALQVPVWKARKVAQDTHHLNKPAARYVDRHLAPTVGSAGYGLISRLIAEAAATHDPEYQRAKEDNARNSSGIELWSRTDTGYAGTSELRAVGDTLDLTAFRDRVNHIARHLAAQGDDSPYGVRQIKAIRILADGQAALDLEGSSTGVTGTGSSVATHLYLHLDKSDLDDEPLARVGTVERLGPVTRAKILDWLSLTHAVLTPVIREDRVDAVDAHDPPEWMAEQVILRDRTCRFPWCGRDARACDLDHIVPCDENGPPGQTRPDNLAPLCRRHHRAKTARRWRYRRLPDGTYLWHGPWHTTYLVTPHGTRPITGTGTGH